MSGLDLHPEDLIDKLVREGLTNPERERFERHLAACGTCRFELSARSDFVQAVREQRRESPIRTDGAGGEPRFGRSRNSGKRALRRFGVLAVAAALFTGASLAAILSRKSPERPPVGHAAAVSTGLAPPIQTKAPARAKAAAQATALLPIAPQAVVQPPTTPSSVLSPRGGAAAPEAGDDGVGPEPLPAPPRAAVPGTRSSSPSSVAFTAASAPTVSAQAGGSLADRRLTAPELFQSANRARRDSDDLRAMALYRTLQAEFPESEEARLSRATLAKLMLDRGNPNGALEGFNEYLLHGDTLLGEEALVGRALALQQLGARKEELGAWREVLRRFPRSVHARLATARLAALGKQ